MIQYIINFFIDVISISVLLYVPVFLMIRINPRLLMHDYPPELRKAVPPRTKKETIQFLIGALLTLAINLNYIMITFQNFLKEYHPSYLHVFLRWLMIDVFVCAVDLFICDYYIVCTLTPKFIIVPGTEHLMKVYKDKTFHTNTIPPMCVISFVLAFLTSLLYFYF